MLAVGEQRVNIQNRNDDNPFVVLPMHDTERSVPDMDLPISEHTEFEVVERGIVCRSGLRLPEWCLHTGGETSMRPLVMNVVAWESMRSFSIGRVFRGVLYGLAGAIGVTLMLTGITSLTGLSDLAVLFVALVPIGVASLVVLWFLRMWSGSQPALPACRLTGFVSRRRHLAGIFLGTLPAVLILASVFTSFVVQSFYLVLSFWGGLWLLQILLGRLFWSGTRLRSQQLPDGRFLITGFAPGYWQRLEALRESGQLE